MSPEKQNPFEEQGKAAEEATKPAAVKTAGAKASESPEPRTYKRVKFHTKSDKYQPNDVILSVNGHTLLLQRDVPVVLPQCFLEAADHATYDQFQPGSGSRKVIAKVRLYPYDVLGEGSEEEYRKMLATGARKLAEAREREDAAQVIK